MVRIEGVTAVIGRMPLAWRERHRVLALRAEPDFRGSEA